MFWRSTSSKVFAWRTLFGVGLAILLAGQLLADETQPLDSIGITFFI